MFLDAKHTTEQQRQARGLDSVKRVLPISNARPWRSPFQWRIQDFPQGGGPTPKIAIIFHIFTENCMKMKEFGPQGGARPWLPPLDPPMHLPNMRNAQPQNKDPWNVRANGTQLENNNTADANLVNSASKSNDKAKIIIVAYMRSGSSLLGHVFR